MRLAYEDKRDLYYIPLSYIFVIYIVHYLGLLILCTYVHMVLHRVMLCDVIYVMFYVSNH